MRALLQQTIRDPYGEHPWVYDCVRLIVDHLVSVPLKVMTGPVGDAREVMSGPWHEVISRPSRDYTRRQFFELAWTYQLLTGEGMLILYGRVGPVEEREVPVELRVAPGHLFRREEKDGRPSHWIFTKDGRPTRLEPHQVVSLRFVDPSNPGRGMAPLKPALRSVRTDDLAARYNEALLSNDGTPGGYVSMRQRLSNKQAKVVKERWEDSHGGADKTGKVAVFGDDGKFVPISRTHQEMEFHGMRKWSREELAAVYRVPLMFLGITEDIHSKESARQVKKLLWEACLLPLLTVTADVLNEQLIRGRGEDVRIEFDLSGVSALKEEEGARRDNAAKDRALGFPLNEVNQRWELGYEDQDESGDVGLVSRALQTTEEAAGLVEDEFDDDGSGPPLLLDEEDEEDLDEGEDGDRGARAVRRSAARERLWKEYVRVVLDPAEKQMRTALRRQVIKVYRAQTLRMVKELFAGEKAVREITDETVSSWLAGHRDEWDGLIVGKTKKATENAVEWTLERTEEQLGGELEVVSMEHPRILELIEELGARKVKAVPTVQKAIRRALLEGAGEGESLTQLQGRIRKLFNWMDSKGALRIARTETAAASTSAKFEALKLEGVERHSWLSAGDDLVRDGHDIDDETVDVGALFSNGLLYPLDPNGRGDQVINCRCEALPEV